MSLVSEMADAFYENMLIKCGGTKRNLEKVGKSATGLDW